MNNIKIIEKIYSSCTKAIVPIFIKRENSTSSMELWGTSFLVFFEEEYFLISARHVIISIKENHLIAMFGKKALILEDILFNLNKENDCAVAKITEEFVAKNNINISDIGFYPIDNEDGINFLDRYLILGYPATKKNILIPNCGKVDRSIHCLSFYERKLHVESDTTVSSPIAFDYSLKGLVNERNEKVTLDKLNGLSGGPIIQLYANSTNHINAKAIGVFLEWHKTKKELIGIDINFIKKLIKQASFEPHSIKE